MIRFFFLHAICFCTMQSNFCQSKQTVRGHNTSLVKPVHQNESVRSVLDLNNNWEFFRGDAKASETVNYQDKNWTAASIPHTMRQW